MFLGSAFQPPRQNFDNGGQVNALNSPTTIAGPTRLAPNATGTAPGGLGQHTGEAVGMVGDYLEDMYTGKPDEMISDIGAIGEHALGIFDAAENTFQGASAPVQAGTNVGQLNQAYDQSQLGIQQQQDLVNRLMAQSGLQNQSDVYNQMQGIANGTGPNPALAQLNQTTGQNVANQAALMAGQRGSNANTGMMARQIANQGANTQQQAAGQAATLAAQQQMQAMNNMGNLANTQAANQIGAIQGYNNAVQNEQNILQGANTNFNNSQVGMQSNINNVNSQTAAGNQAAQGNAMSGIMGLGSSLLGAFMAEGGEVKKMADGGEISGPQSMAGQWLRSDVPIVGPGVEGTSALPNMNNQQNASEAGAGLGTSMADMYKSQSSSSAPQGIGIGSNVAGGGGGGFMNNMLAKGGKVPALVSPGERYLSPKDVQQVAKGANPMKQGEKVPGKPKVGGAKNSYSNDTVKATLQEGGIVLPRSVTQAKDAPERAAAFVRAIMAKNGQLPKKSK